MLDIGTVLQNRYRIVVPLGQGGMGAVYQAWDNRLQVSVAVKEMTPQSELELKLLAQLRQQFEQEAVTLARLNHPNLVRVTDFFEEQANAYLVMNFVEGESLAARITRVGALPEACHRTLVGRPRPTQMANALLGALSYCHQQKVIHRAHA